MTTQPRRDLEADNSDLAARLRMREVPPVMRPGQAPEPAKVVELPAEALRPAPPPKPAVPHPKRKVLEEKKDRELSDSMKLLRSGSRVDPYPREDGVETARLTVTIDVAVVQREREFSARLTTMSRGQFIERALVEFMDKYEKKKG